MADGQTETVAADAWDPEQYQRFEAERRQPFDDLVALVRPVPGGRALDLGCGTGALTAELHVATKAAKTLGIDTSAAMLAATAGLDVPGLRFRLGDAAQIPTGEWDLIFANACLQWVPDHLGLVPRLRSGLSPGGQLAFQVPANYDHVSHRLAAEIAAEAPFDLRGNEPAPVLAPEQYAELLDRLGSVEQQVRLQVYGHHLESADAVVEWVKGTLLTRYRSRLEAAAYDEFVARYRAGLTERLGPARPYFYAFKRILAWARFE